MQLSIIVPVYGVEAYIAACLESLLPMPDDRVEILCVDDQSTDGSRSIIESYAALHPHIRLLTHDRNQGLSAARNTGLARATGEYILFVDSDDTVDAQAVWALLKEAKEQQLDMAEGLYRLYDDISGDELPVASRPSPTEVITGDDCLARLSQSNTFEPMVVSRLYRRLFLLENRLAMAEGMTYEDELFTAPALLLAKRVQVTEKVIYHYRIRKGSIMGRFAASSAWCSHYLAIAQQLSALGSQGPDTPGKSALRRRAGQIALSLGKNIPAYRLKAEVRAQAMTFLRDNSPAIAAIIQGSPVLAERLQGMLLQVSPRAFLLAYRFFMAGERAI